MAPSSPKTKRQPTAKSGRRTATVNLRLARETRELIDTAAAMLGKTRTEFVVETARRQAIDVVLDRRLIVLDEAQHEAFMQLLESPPPPNEALKKLMASKPPWEK